MSSINFFLCDVLNNHGFPYLADQLRSENMTKTDAIRYLNSIAWDLSTSEYEFILNCINDFFFFKPTNQPTK